MKTTAEKVFYDLCRRTNSPVSLGLWLRFRLAPSELAEATIDPMDYIDPVSFSADYACLCYLRKYRGLKTGIDLRERAILKFGKSEEKCRETNRNLQMAALSGRVARVEPCILQKAQQLIATIWGSPTFRQLFDQCGWGPGSTSSLKSTRANREDKMSQYPVSITPAAVPYFQQMIRDHYMWASHLIGCKVDGPVCLTKESFELTSSSRLLTVPKDSRGDRTICAEPTANIYLQKGVGKWLRKRLRRHGVDLDDQSINQNLAAIAHVSGLATLDLAAASDSVSIGVVRLLCPPDMFELLNSIRSPAYRLDGVEARFHKFSSMGNGFTFELESLIFFAILKAIKEVRECQKPIGVYGDDLVCGREIASEVIDVLDALGFSTNVEKSFVHGVFYESCGKHYFHGIDVTPMYQKAEVSDELEYSRLCNRLIDYIKRDTFDLLGRRRLYGGIHSKLVKERPPRLKRCLGPAWVEGDGFIKVFNDSCVFKPGRGFVVHYLARQSKKPRLSGYGILSDELRLSAVNVESRSTAVVFQKVGTAVATSTFSPRDWFTDRLVEKKRYATPDFLAPR